MSKDSSLIAVFLHYMEVIQLLVTKTNTAASTEMYLTVITDVHDCTGYVHLFDYINLNRIWHQGHTEKLLVHSWTFLYIVRFQVLTAPSMKMALFWDVAPCSLVNNDWHFKGTCCFIIGSAALMTEAVNMLLWNISQYLPDYVAEHPKGHTSSLLYTILQ
jgi:hypothetical protein